MSLLIEVLVPGVLLVLGIVKAYTSPFLSLYE